MSPAHVKVVHEEPNNWDVHTSRCVYPGNTLDGRPGNAGRNQAPLRGCEKSVRPLPSRKTYHVKKNWALHSCRRGYWPCKSNRRRGYSGARSRRRGYPPGAGETA
eukprot:12870083-Alexandrium_andersonii.AAC.1